MMVTLTEDEASWAALWVRIGVGKYEAAGKDFASQATKSRALAEKLEGK